MINRLIIFISIICIPIIIGVYAYLKNKKNRIRFRDLRDVDRYGI